MRIDPSTLDLKEKVVFINRVTKVVKGGRNFRFSALVVVGDENGHVGVGMGKSIEIPEAIKKGIEDAKKNMVSVAIVGTTVTLVKSLIGRKKDHIATANALGLRKINKTVEHEDTPQIRGMINKVDYLLKVEEV